MKKGIILFLLLVLMNVLNAQDTTRVLQFSLKESQEYAVKNSYKMQNAGKDIEIAKKKIWETTSIGLPQVNSSMSFQDYIDIPTQMIPNFIQPVVESVLLQKGLITASQMSASSGEMIAVQFGTKYNTNIGFSGSQLIFDGSYIVGLQAAKTYLDLSKNNFSKSEIEVKEEVAQAYYLVLVAEENQRILDSTLANMKKILYETQEYQKNGFSEETDVDQMQLLVSDLSYKQSIVKQQLEITYNLLKFQMGLNIDQKIMLSDKLSDIVSAAIAENLFDKSFNYNDHVDYKLFLTQQKLTELNLRRDRYEYLPRITGVFSFQENAMRDEFNFFEAYQPWYKTTLIGFSLSLPIWDSGIKHFKIQQDKLEVQKNKVLQKQIEQSLQLNVQNARLTLKTYSDQYFVEKDNMNLSKNIYEKNLVKYKEGVATSLELAQAQNQYLTTQGNYFNTTLELLKAKSSLNKALNNY